MKENFRFANRVLIATAVVVSVLLVLVLVWYAVDLLMLLFLGVLLSIPLRRMADFLASRAGLRYGVSLAIITVAALALAGTAGWLVAGRIAAQANEFNDQIRTAFETVRARLETYAWFRESIEQLPSLGELLREPRGVLSRITGFASSAAGFLISVVIVMVVAIYIASQPGLYSMGIKHLLPIGYRDRAAQVLGVIDEALGRWLIGRIALMCINGVLTALALSIIGVPLAVTLGVIAGLLNFIPNFGPFIAAIPALLIAFVKWPVLALYTALIYVIVQMVDGYILTPLVDRRSVELPPVITVAAQVLLGLLYGFAGLLVASPLTATVMILVKMLYIEDVLGDPIMEGSVVANTDTRKAA